MQREGSYYQTYLDYEATNLMKRWVLEKVINLMKKVELTISHQFDEKLDFTKVIHLMKSWIL